MDLAHYGARRSGRLWVADFTALPAGACSALPAMLLHTRGSGATVQTGTSSVVVGLGTDVAGIGRALDADALGLVLEESRTNAVPFARDTTGAGWSAGSSTTETTAQTGPDGAAAATRSQVLSGGFSRFCAVGSRPAGSYAVSLWVSRPAGSAASQWSTVYNAATAWERAEAPTVGAAWQRRSLVLANPATNAIGIVPTDARASTGYGGVAAAAQDLTHDLHQIEAGSFATEAIVTSGAAATRAGARLWHPYSAIVADRGRIGLELTLQPKGATTDYSADPYLWRASANNYATISKADGKVTIVIAGSSYTTASGFTWAAGDSVDLWIEAGGRAMQSVVKMRKNGGAVTVLGTSPSPQAALPVNGTLDILQNGSAAAVLSCRARKLATYASGSRPGWAA